MSVEAFGIEKEFLHELLKQGQDGRLQLPDFQRGWVWPVENITALLASVSLGYPVGTVMMLRTGGEARFAQRPIERVDLPAHAAAQRLLLDGQQRLTSLFQALMLGQPIETEDERGRPLSGWYYADIRAALDESRDREEAFRFVHADRVVRDFRRQVLLDVSSPDKEYENQMFPLDQVFDPDAWSMGFQEHHGYERAAVKRWNAFNRQFIKRFEQYLMPVIELGERTQREAVCQVFEKVNTGGVTLTVFELLTATYAASQFNLRNDWAMRQASWSDPKYRVLHSVESTDFLQAVTLLATYRRASEPGADRTAIGCRRSEMLRLSLAEYQEQAPAIVEGFLSAAKFLHHQHIFDVRYVPYGTQLIPLAAIFAALGPEAETYEAQRKITQWYWRGVFGELYGGAVATRFARDLPEVVAWVHNSGEAPRTVQDASFQPGRLRTLRTRNSAAYKGLYALLIGQGAVDWRTGRTINAATYFDDAIDIHHIFPQAWAVKNGLKRSDYDSIANKTPLSAKTNRIVGGSAPSEYLARLSKDPGPEIIDGHLSTHLVAPALLRADHFEKFLAAREESLLDLIHTTIG